MQDSAQDSWRSWHKQSLQTINWQLLFFQIGLSWKGNQNKWLCSVILKFPVSEKQTFSQKDFFCHKQFFSCLFILSFQLEWLMATDIIFNKNAGGKTSKLKYLFESNLSYFGYFKYFMRLVFQEQNRFPWTPPAKATHLYKLANSFSPI